MSDTEAPAAPVPVAAPGSFTVETAVQVRSNTLQNPPAYLFQE